MNNVPLEDLLGRLEAEAQTDHVPILKKDGIQFLLEILRTRRVRRVLEIGTATGYSALAMAALPGVEVVSLERDLSMFSLAQTHVREAGFEDRIRLIFADALTMDVSDLGAFDLLFIDAAKGQNRPLFDKFAPMVRSGGAIVVDNLLFHGFVEAPETILSRDRRQMIHKIQDFVEYIQHLESYDFRLIHVGDGIGLCLKK